MFKAARSATAYKIRLPASMATSYISSTESMRAEKRSVARNSVIAAVGITALKILVGFATGSLGLISEAAHSGLDLIAAVITFFSVGVADNQTDEDNHYGHGKVRSEERRV